jgi:hypothetical protein
MKNVSAKLVGISPLMTHNEQLANPLNPVTRELKKLTGQRGKSDEMLEQIMKLEWLGGLYTEAGKVVMPGDNVIACLKEGARKRKQGKDFAAGVMPSEATFALQYDGPKEPEALWNAGSFLDYRGVVVGGKRIMRARPIFRAWALDVAFTYDPEIVNEEQIIEALQIAGERCGLCERRPSKGGSFGRFMVEA